MTHTLGNVLLVLCAARAVQRELDGQRMFLQVVQSIRPRIESVPMDNVPLPSYDSFIPPVLEALRRLGGSATNEEINTKVAELLGLTEEQLQVPHRPNLSKVAYRLHWARSYLKAFGLIDNSTRGVWSLTPAGRDAGQIDGREVAKAVRAMGKKAEPQVVVNPKGIPEPEGELPEDEEVFENWRDQLSETLLKMTPAAFERLAQRVLRESGFVQVEVTGRSGDGGIDGKGILRLGLLSFHVNFQCKRYKDVVGPAIVREFRGAMMGRADKGLIITTGTFTKEAVREATRDGAPAIDLVDGEQLIDRLKELALGVTTRQVEEVAVNREWFETL